MRALVYLMSVLFVASPGLWGSGELSGRRAPGFSLPDSRLRQHDLADHRGKIVLLEIMQTNCPHCRTLAGILEEVKAKYGDRVAILSVVNPPDNQTTVARYISETKTTSPVLFDCGQMSASYLMATPDNPVINVPHLFIIDGEGMIRNDFGYGPKTKEYFEGRALFTELDRILGEGEK